MNFKTNQSQAPSNSLHWTLNDLHEESNAQQKKYFDARAKFNRKQK